jgi:Domain of unknown function (DUF4034)
MMAAVRAYGTTAETDALHLVENTQSAVTQPPLESESVYEQRISKLFYQENFEQLDKEAQDARVNKTRVLGGTWKIYSFYEAVAKPTLVAPVDADDNVKIPIMKRWIAALPESATAQIALAELYVNLAWLARGSGYADTVTDSGWRLFSGRLELAKGPLLKAGRLKEKCPFWYSVVMSVALGEGWDKSDAREIRDQANIVQPAYYHIDLQYANFILPKWYGEEGETQSFAAEAADKAGGQQGDFLYFELASVAVCTCKSDKPSMENLSWPRIKRGYAAHNQLYGVTQLKANRYALMAYAEDDKPTARQAFANVGNDLPTGIWRSRQSFDYAKSWATSQ